MPESPSEAKSTGSWWTKVLHVLVPLALALSWSVAYLSQEVKNLEELFDSDGLTLELIWVDIFQNGGRWADWYPPHAPRFIPDMALYFGVREFVPDAYWAIYLFGLGLLFLLYAPAVWLARNEGGSPAAVTLTQVTFLATIAFLAIEGYRPYSFTYAATFHTGILIHGLLLIIFHGYLRRSPSTLWPWGAITILSVVGAASDLIFVITYLAPFCGVLILEKLLGGPNFNLKLVGTVALSVVTGMLLKKQLILDTTPAYFDFSSSWEKAWTIPANFMGMLERNPVTSTLCCLFYFLIISQVVSWFLARFKSANPDPFPFWQLTFVVSAVLLVLALGIRGLCEPIYVPTIKDSRLLITIVFNAILVPWLPIKDRLKGAEVPLTGLAYLVLLVVVFKFNPFSRSYQSEYRPVWIAEIDRHLSEYQERTGRQLKRGVATYWPTKATLALSKHDLAIGQYRSTLERYYCLNSVKWYHDDYDFALIEYTDYDEEFLRNLIQASGQPEALYRCGNLQLAIFPKDALNSENFFVDLWKMAAAPGVKRLADDALFSPAGEEEGEHIVFYGPYVRLFEGEHEVVLDFKIEKQSAGGSFRCEVFFTEKDKVAIQETVDLPTKSSDVRVALPFKIEQDMLYLPVEFRIWKQGPFDLTLTGISLNGPGSQ